MEVKYEIRIYRSIVRIRKSIDGDEYFWKIIKKSEYGEELVTIGCENTLDSAYKQAKRIYEELAK